MHHRHFASLLGSMTTIAAIACAAAIGSGKAYAETPTIDNTPFVSMRTRDEVRAEVLSQRALLSAAASEWNLQRDDTPRMASAYTRMQARQDFEASRAQTRAITSEDSGSSYFAQQMPSRGHVTMMARAAR